MPRGPDPWRRSGTGLVLSIHLAPRAAHDRIDGRAALPGGPVIKARVRAVPEDGKANAALEALLADWLGLAKSSVRVTSGHASRLKSVTISPAADSVAQTLADRLPSE